MATLGLESFVFDTRELDYVVNAAKSKLLKFTVLPLYLGTSATYAGATGHNILDELANKSSFIINGDDLEGDPKKKLKFDLDSGTFQWNADMQLLGSHGMSFVVPNDANAAIDLKGSGSLLVNLSDPSSEIDFSFMSTDNSHGNDGLNIAIDSIEVKSGMLNFVSAGRQANINADKIVVGSEEGTGWGFLRVSDAQKTTIGGDKTEFYLYSDGYIQMPGRGDSVIEGRLVGKGGTLEVFSDHTAVDQSYNHNLTMKLWGSDVNANLVMNFGSNTTLDIKDDPTTYHHDEGTLHVTKGTITLTGAGKANTDTKLTINSGTLWIDKGVKLISSDQFMHHTNTVQLIANDGGTLKLDFDNFTNFLKLNASTTTVKSQMVLNGGTIWFTDQEKFDLYDKFQAIQLYKNKNPLVINNTLNGVAGNPEIMSHIFVKNSVIKKSIDADLSHVGLITHNLYLSETGRDPLRLNNSNLTVVESLNNDNSTDELTLASLTGREKVQFFFNPDACINKDPNHPTPTDLNVNIKNVTLDKGVEFNFQHGHWKAHNITVKDGGFLTVGNENDINGATLDASQGKLTIGAGQATVKIFEDGVAKFSDLDMSKSTHQGLLEVAGKLHILGNKDAFDHGNKAWSLDLSGKGKVVVKGDSAELYISNNILSNFNFKGDELQLQNGYDHLGKNISLYDGATLVLDFAKGSVLTVEQIQNLANATLTDDHSRDVVVDLGGAVISEVAEVHNSATLSKEQLNKLYDEYHVLKHLKVNSITSAAITGYNSNDQVEGHVGAVILDSGDTVKVGAGSLNSAYNGMFTSSLHGNGHTSFDKAQLANLEIDANKTFRLIGGGETKNVKVNDGANFIVASNDGTTKIKSIEASNAKVNIQSGHTEVAGDVKAGTFKTMMGSTTDIKGNLTINKQPIYQVRLMLMARHPQALSTSTPTYLAMAL